MEKLNYIEIASKDLINYYVPEYRFKWSNAVREYGYCSYTNKEISVSQNLAALNPVEQTLDTILHEIAHALAGHKEHHSEVWKQRALAIGCDGERVYGKEVVRPVPSYSGTCPGCHKVIKRVRRSRISCSKCGNGHFNPNFMFQWSKEVGECGIHID